MKKYWLGALLLISMPAWAVEPYGATPAEQAMCQARVYSKLGKRDENTMHMHHYCDGLRFLDRAYSASIRNKREVKYNVDVAIGNFNYILSHTKDDYVMRGEVHVGIARALKLLGRKGAAVAEFYKALRYDLGTADAFQALADYYLETGNKEKALEMTTEGLRRIPDTKGLKRRYTELGGKLPYPEPLVKQPSPAPAAEVASSSPSPNPATVTSPEANVPAAPADQPAAPSISPPEPPKIGSPTNPWCRFCPDPVAKP
ncbi:MAG: hypothetical protein WCB97_01140 [Thiobacillus sp.]